MDEKKEVTYEELKAALIDVCDGNFKCWEDIQYSTGFDEKRCNEIWSVYSRLVKRG
jgi:hypothetical protein